MHPTLPDAIQPLMQEYLTQVEQRLPGLMTACYLHGSVALGAFEPALSDVDFITVVSRRCTPDDLAQLATIHAALEKRYPPLQGSYLQADDLGKLRIEPAPYYSDGVLHPSGRHDINSVTWWVLKNKGITRLGPPPDYEVDWDLLVTKMQQNLHNYWGSYIRDPRRMAWLLSDYGVQWTVLGTLRQVYTFAEHDITSKTGAGEYALHKLPARWHRIIREALRIRQQEPGALYRSRFTRALDAFRFLQYIIGSQ
jgi:hypothetical protein